MRTVFEARASTILFRLAAAVPETAGVFLLPANVCPVVLLALLAARPALRVHRSRRTDPLYERGVPARASRGAPGPAGRRRRLRPDLLGELRWLQTDRPAMAWDEYRDLVLTRRDELERRRSAINAVYRSHIGAEIRLPSGYHQWRFQVRIARPAALLEKIFAAGFFASRHYFPAAVLFGGHACPAAAALHGEIVNLFNDLRVSESDADAIGHSSPATSTETAEWVE